MLPTKKGTLTVREILDKGTSQVDYPHFIVNGKPVQAKVMEWPDAPGQKRLLLVNSLPAYAIPADKNRVPDESELLLCKPYETHTELRAAIEANENTIAIAMDDQKAGGVMMVDRLFDSLYEPDFELSAHFSSVFSVSGGLPPVRVFHKKK